MNTPACLVVAGIARSGLSVTMQMLHAGGYPCKGEYPAFECFPVGAIPWAECGGFAVKLVDAQLQLPPPGDYRVIRLVRDMKQQAMSMNRWNSVVLGLPSCSVSRLVGSYRRDYAAIDQWASQYPVLELDFERIVTDSRNAATAIRDFVGASLDIERMAAVVVDRSPEVHPTLLELTLLGSTQEPT